MASCSNSSAIGAADLPPSDPRIRCQFCATAKVQVPPGDQLVPDSELLPHLAAHFHYRPHRCAECQFECYEPGEIITHVKLSGHSSVEFNATQNAFMEEMCNIAAEECRRRHIFGPIVTSETKHSPVSAPSSPEITAIMPNLVSNASAASGGDLDYSEFATDQQLDDTPGTSSAAASFAMLMAQTPQDIKHDIKQQLQQPSSSTHAGTSSKARKMQLQKHNFECLHCGKQNMTFRRAKQQYHCNGHLGLPLFRCRLCDTTFRSDCYGVHLRTLHSYEGPSIDMVDRLEQNWALLKAQTKEMVVPMSSKKVAEPNAVPSKISGGGMSMKYIPTLAKVQCSQCEELVPDIESSRLQHANSKHLRLVTYQCPVCGKQFMTTTQSQPTRHAYEHHPQMSAAARASIKCFDWQQKMELIRAEAAKLFPN